MGWHINSCQYGGMSIDGGSVGDAKGAGKVMLVQVLCVQAEDYMLRLLLVQVLA